MQGVAAWDGYLTIARHLTIDWGLSAAGDFNGMAVFNPVEEIKTLRRKLLYESDDAFKNLTDLTGGAAAAAAGSSSSSSSGSELWLPSAAGTALDIEISFTWPDGSSLVPEDFGSVGVAVLADPVVAGHGAAGAAQETTTPPPRAAAGAADGGSDDNTHRVFSKPQLQQEVEFDSRLHGPGVTIGSGGATLKSNNSLRTMRTTMTKAEEEVAHHETGAAVAAAAAVATWGGAAAGGRSTGSACNQVAFLTGASASTSYWLSLGPREEPWTDIGWCSKSLDATGAKWVGPTPKWIGWQGSGKAWCALENTKRQCLLLVASRA
jgi:hypothetical protein